MIAVQSETRPMTTEDKVGPQLVPPLRIIGYALRLRGIRVQSRIGVPAAERASAQELIVAVDVELGGDCETFALRAAQSLARCWPGAALVRFGVTKAIVPTLPTAEQAVVEVTLGQVAS
jgi:hypothetical protein